MLESAVREARSRSWADPSWGVAQESGRMSRGLGAALFPGWPGRGAVRGPREWRGYSKSLWGSQRSSAETRDGGPGPGAAPSPGVAPAARAAGETLLTCPELLSTGWAPSTC